MPANKTLLGFSLSIVLILFVGITSYLTILRYDDNAGWVNHTHEVISNINELDRRITETEATGRAYLLSGDDRFLVLFNDAAVHIEFLQDRFREMTMDNFYQTRRIDSLRPLLAERIGFIRKRIQIRQAGTLADVLAQTDMHYGLALQAAVDVLITEMREDEELLLTERNKKMDASKLGALLTDVGGTLVGLAVALALLWYIMRTFAERERVRASLQESNESLEKVSEENQRRNWLLTGASDLNTRLRGEMSLAALAQEAISELCTRVGAQLGALYVMNEETKILQLAGSFAYPLPPGPAPEFALREGLVGQAAFENRPLSVDGLLKDRFRVRTGLGDLAPRFIEAWPVDHEGITAVVELGLEEPLAGSREEYFRLISKDIAVAIQMAVSRTRLNELNDRLQRQAEELQLQQEELQATNEELTRQSEQLQASEEELRVQQEELMQANLQLEEKAQQLKENVEALEIARREIMNKAEEVERNSRYKTEFLANMSHELRTPLNSILILAKLLSENKDTNLTDKQVEYAGVIHKSGQDLLTLINDVLDLSKIEAGKATVSLAPVPVTQLRTDMVSVFREVAEAGQIQFTTDIDPLCPKEIYTDKDRLEQILRNLLSNAFKFTHEGGTVRLHIAAVNPQTVAFRVTDSGIGIPEGQQEVIFEAFRQADGSTNRKYGGTGLGLSISRQLAAMLGGSLDVESVAGKGSTFSLLLPVVFTPKLEDSGTIPDPPAVGEEPLLAGKVLLIVEDDPVFSNILRDFARDKGYETVLASRGDTALQYAKAYLPTAILLDIQLPVVDGWTVLKRLKADAATRSIPVHVISGFDDRARGIEMGAISFIHKPLGKDDLDGVFSAISASGPSTVKKVLIVEDDAVQWEYLDRILREKERDITCVHAADGGQALQRVGEDIFDCIIVDLTLPDMSGFTLLEHLENSGLPSKTKIIVHTGKDLDKEDALRLRRFTNTIVLKGGRSHERLLDEVALFLHKVEEKNGDALSRPHWNIPSGDDVLKGKKALLVDDDMRNVFALSATLQEHGLEVVVAGDGREGLDRLADQPGIQIVLMDIMMPEMDGYEAMRHIRSDKALMGLPIIALTAKAMKDDREKCIAAGASDYITKPVDIDQLLSLMRVWLYNSL
ncbi:response regulator [Dinghuibacter silviterrae]|uniref:response regulator n=1 Tax=Dinghuibacter silviterrae TaxID=1539049 RepID=UPI0013C2D776|nr:response regulator [Dinghuibacter silviterrae]